MAVGVGGDGATVTCNRGLFRVIRVRVLVACVWRFATTQLGLSRSVVSSGRGSFLLLARCTTFSAGSTVYGGLVLPSGGDLATSSFTPFATIKHEPPSFVTFVRDNGRLGISMSNF